MKGLLLLVALSAGFPAFASQARFNTLASFDQGPGGPPRYLAVAHTVKIPETVPCPPGGCGATGSLSGQNVIFTDPDFGTVGVRASDAHTFGLYQTTANNRGIQNGALESENRQWNTNGSMFYAAGEGGVILPAFFNPQTMHVTWVLCGPGSTGCSNNRPAITYAGWDGTNPRLLYGTNNTAPQIYSYDFSACTDPGNANSVSCKVTQSTSPLYDFNNCPGISSAGGWENRNWGGSAHQGVDISDVSMDGNTFVTSLGLRAVHDLDPIIAVWNKTKGCLWFNANTMVMGGDTDSAHWNINGVPAGTPITMTGFQPAPAPAAPSLSQTTGGSLPLDTYTVSLTYSNTWIGQQANGGESLPGSSAITLTSSNAIQFSAPAAILAQDGNPPMAWGYGTLNNAMYAGYNIYACEGSNCTPTWQPGNASLRVNGLTCTGDLGAGSVTYTYTVIPFNSTAMGVPSKCTITQAARPSSGGASVTTLNWTSVSGSPSGCMIVADNMTVKTTSFDGLNLSFNCSGNRSFIDNCSQLSCGTSGGSGSTAGAFKGVQLNSVKSTSGTFTLTSLTAGLAPQPTSTSSAPQGSLGASGTHDLLVNDDGSWVLERGGTRLFWQLGTTNVVECGGVAANQTVLPAYGVFAFCSGHEALGKNFHYGRTGGDPTTAVSEGNALTVRPLDATLLSNPYRVSFKTLPGPASSTNSIAFGWPVFSGAEDCHPSAEAVTATSTIFLACFDAGVGNGYHTPLDIERAWDRELYGLSQAHSFPPSAFRFAHYHTISGTATKNGPGSYCGSGQYYECGFVAVSRDGRFAIVTSAWNYMLGCEHAYAACRSHTYDSQGTLLSAESGAYARNDIFIYRIR